MAWSLEHERDRDPTSRHLSQATTMQEPAGTVKSDDNQAYRAAQRQPDERNRPEGAKKFVFASGSQPLAGYTIKRGIGIGGFGEVYYAISDAGKDVALKLIQRNLDVELRGVKQCLNLKHPNLLDLYDIRYDDDDRAWVIMEYVAGEVLREVIERNPNGMPVAQVRLWMDGIASGVAYLHDHGIVHRDLKPGNIFLDQGVVKIGDYGLSKFISTSRRSGQTESVGTFHYMAPEIGRGRYGKEIDVYALGIILYEMLTGHVPYDGESSQEIIMKHLTAEPRLDVVPPSYRGAVSKALTKDPAMRLGSVSQLLGELPLLGKGSAQVDRLPEPSVQADPVSRGDARPTAPYTDQTGPDNADAIVLAQAVRPNSPGPQEPIARAVYDVWLRTTRSWHSANLGAVPRFIIIAALLVALVVNLRWLLPLGITLGACYLVYLVIRALRTQPGVKESFMPAPSPAPPPPPSRPQPVRITPKRRRSWDDLAREVVGAKSFGQWLTELTGSLIVAAIACAVISLVMTIFGSEGLGTSVLAWGPLYAWMTLTSVAGTWGVLVSSKCWEGSTGEASLRRFTMLAVGLMVGGGAFLLSQLLEVEPTYFLDTPTFHNYPTALFEPEGTPNALGYLGYFAGLFLVPRWWKQADLLRPARLSIWATLLCVLWSIVVFAFLPFPRGFMIAATVSIAVQLSAPWMTQAERKTLRQTAQEN